MPDFSCKILWDGMKRHINKEIFSDITLLVAGFDFAFTKIPDAFIADEFDIFTAPDIITLLIIIGVIGFPSGYQRRL